MGRWFQLGLAANALVTLESLVGLMGFAIVTGLLFSRFSRPTAKLLFSQHALIAPYQNIHGVRVSRRQRPFERADRSFGESTAQPV